MQNRTTKYKAYDVNYLLRGKEDTLKVWTHGIQDALDYFFSLELYIDLPVDNENYVLSVVCTDPDIVLYNSKYDKE